MFQFKVHLTFRAEVRCMPEREPGETGMQVVEPSKCRRIFYDIYAEKTIDHKLPPVLGATLVIDGGQVTINEVSMGESSYSLQVTASSLGSLARILGEPKRWELEREEYFKTVMELGHVISPKGWKVTVLYAPFLYAAS